MKIEIYGKPDFWFALTDEQMAVLEELADVHYDTVCKMSNMTGGFMYGWRNARHGAPDAKLKASFREIDTCLKILELLMTPPAALTEAQQIVGHKLVRSFRAALAHANTETQRWSMEIDA